MDPKRFILSSQPEQLDLCLIVNAFQNGLRSLLEAFLNGSYLGHSAKILFPLSTKANEKTTDRLHYLLRLLHLINQKLSQPVPGGKRAIDQVNALLATRLSSKSLAQAISALYQQFDGVIEGQDRKQKLQVHAKPFKSAPYNAPELRPVRELKAYVVKQLAPFLRGFYLHGSVSTLDYNAYSDLDTLMIVNRSTLEDWRNLHRLSLLSVRSTRFLYAFDPLQHHGHMVLSEHDLDYYCSSFLPPVLFDYSTSLLDSGSRLQIHERPSSFEARSRLWKMVQSFRQFYLAHWVPSSAYQLKGLFSRFMLLPSLYLQVLGQNYYKGLSFGLAANHFSRSLWTAMDEVSDIRRNWRYQPSLGARMLLKLRQPIWIRLSHKLTRHWDGLRPLGDEFPEKMFRLSEEMWDNNRSNISLRS